MSLCLAFGQVAVCKDRVDREQLSAWLMQQGAPADIWAIAQGPQGFLWLGTGTGLYRFDGVSFEHVTPRHGATFATANITALEMLADGTLWIGFFSGGSAALKDGMLRTFNEGDGFPEGMVEGFAQDGAGTLWAATGGGLARFDGRRWSVVGKAMGYPTRRASWVIADREGTIWVATGQTLVFLPRGASTFVDTGIRTGPAAVMAQAPDGTFWLSDDVHGTRALPGLDARHPSTVDEKALPRTGFAYAKRLLFDEEGQLWGTDAREGGVYRVNNPSRIRDGRPLVPADIDRRVHQENGLASDIAVPLFEDREGNVWTGTNLGLNSFRLRDVYALEGVGLTAVSHYALSPSANDTVWLTYGGSLYRIVHGDLVPVMRNLPDPAAITATNGGDVWFTSPEGLLRIREGQSEPIALPPGIDVWTIQTMVGDREGTLWVGFFRHGIYRYAHGHWTAWNNDAGLASGAPTAMAVSSDNSLALGYVGDRLLVVHDGKVRSYGTDDGLHVGAVTAIDVESDEILIGGDSGMARLRHGRISTLGQDRLDALRGISGIIRSPDGMVWVNSSLGIVRIADDELDKALVEPRHPVEYRLFDSLDGLHGVALQASISSTVGRDQDGRLWFATNQGVSSIDPSHVHRNRTAPPVIIRALDVNGMAYPAQGDVRLPQGTGNIRIQYTATSLTVPERVRFRYRLKGIDDRWQEAGNRREAFYTNLPPGKYHFQVIASNDDGVWNRQGAIVNFHIPPLFYQTRWFLTLCILAAIATMAGSCMLRVRHAAMRARFRIEERLAERERIARELHDTLLQATQGLVLRFQAVAEKIPPSDPVRALIDRTLDRADDVLAEGRDRVKGLRASADFVQDLPCAFAALGEELLGEDSRRFEVVVEGAVRMLEPMVREELYRIGYEATANAVQHAEADRIELELDYGVDEFRLRVRDNGRGIDDDVLETGGKPGHWGLSGMRERAVKIGATLDIWSRPHSGTEVDVRLPAAIAYCSGVSTWTTRLRQLVVGGRHA